MGEVSAGGGGDFFHMKLEGNYMKRVLPSRSGLSKPLREDHFI